MSATTIRGFVPGAMRAVLRGAARRSIAAVHAALLAAVLAAGATSVLAQTGTYNPETTADPATEARVKSLGLELRCLVCQNQTIADSNADLAVDLRRQVREMILQGKSDADIKNYLVARYGDFVLYKPPVQGNTALLWIAPFGLLVVGVGIWFTLSRKRAANAAVAEAALSTEDQAKAKSLLES